MLSISSTTTIYVAAAPADMRRSFDGLCGLVQSAMQLDPACGALFVFRNRRGTQLKILYRVGDGWAIWHRRLEQGTFVVFDFTQSESQAGPNTFLSKYRGYIQCDAGSAFRGLFGDPRCLRLEVGCAMHARRRFYKAKEQGDGRAGVAIARIARLYRIEDEIGAMRATWAYLQNLITELPKLGEKPQDDALMPLLPCKRVTA
jgi:hypothetical protein